MTTNDETTGLSDVQARAIQADLEEQLRWRNVQLRDLQSALDAGAEETTRLALLADAAAAERAVAELRKALDRLYDRTFGRCGGCGAAIPFSRLKIRPLARYCIDCQRRHEAR
jgi:DnaK suppressor protein